LFRLDHEAENAVRQRLGVLDADAFLARLEQLSFDIAGPLGQLYGSVTDTTRLVTDLVMDALEAAAALGGIAIGIGMLGIVIDVRELGRDQSRTAREQAFRLDLAQLLTEGNQLVSAVPRDEDAVAMDAAYSAAQVWGSAVTDRLDAEHPGWSAVFLDDTFGTQLFAGNAPRQSILQNWYQRRLTRLRELWARVP